MKGSYSFISNAFMLPNDLIDKGYMAQMKGPALACYLFIVRKTRGWNKSDDSISISQLVEGTGYGRDSVLSGASLLVEMGIIERISFTNQPAKYTLTDSIFAVENIDGEKSAVENIDSAVENIDSTQSKISTHNNNLKTTNTKTNISKEKPKKTRAEKSNDFDAKTVELPTHVNRDLWIQFVDMRNAKRKPLTENAVSLLIKKLKDFGVGANESLENSIIGGYQGLFAPKQPYVPASLNNQSEEPGYFNQAFHQYQESDVIDVTPDCAVQGGLTHV